MDTKESFIADLKSKAVGNRKELFRFVCESLPKVNKHYNWVGIYVLKGQRLVLGMFHGEKTEHEIISLGDGLCSQAIVTNAIVNEPDVKGNSKYLACFPSTRSELVIPIRYDGVPIGELDLDSDKESAFSPEDEAFLTEVCSMIARRVNEIYEP